MSNSENSLFAASSLAATRALEENRARMKDLKDNLIQAIQRREELIPALLKEQTNAFRLFHGTNEGQAGLTVDRYGDQALIQTFREPITTEDRAGIEEVVCARFPEITQVVYKSRSEKRSTESGQRKTVCMEMGVTYVVRSQHRGQDPLLFLDLRAGRRRLLQISRDLCVLNLFAYTCGAGVCAACAGAREVWNVDFAASALKYGEENAALNNVEEKRIRFVHENVIPVVRQLAGLEVKGRAAKKKQFQIFEPRQFDLVFLDPPRWAKTPFGAIDLVRDYQSLFKPALLATREGGRIFCTNHVPGVDLDVWLDLLRRCAKKNNRPVRHMEVIEPEPDFPSKDGRHPLKMVLIDV
jgi:23S rRNA (cytosine1962-C5)-methyltransferase